MRRLTNSVPLAMGLCCLFGLASMAQSGGAGGKNGGGRTPPPGNINGRPSGNGSDARPAYFGYIDVADQRLYDAIPETAGEINLAWIGESECCNVAAIAKYHVSRLLEAKARGIKSLVALEWIFFTGPKLRDDWKARWERYAGILAPHAPSVAAIYPIDEPYELCRASGFALPTMTTQLRTVAEAIRSRFPGVPLLVTCQWFSLDRHLDLTMYDRIGFDHYYSDFAAVRRLLTELDSELLPGQMAYLVPWAFSNHRPATEDDIQTLLQQASDYRGLALSDPHVWGVFPYLFQTAGWVSGSGLDQMPSVRAQWQSYRNSIMK